MEKTTYLFLISFLAAVNGRPQSVQNPDTPVENPIRVSIVPFYGGAKGQSLQISEYSNGDITSIIIKTPENHKELEKETTITAEHEHIEMPPLPSKHEQTFGDNLRDIQNTAIKIIQLQEIAKQNGEFTKEEESLYNENMDILNNSVNNMARVQDRLNPTDVEQREGLSAWFERKATNSKDKKKKEDEKKKKEEEKKKKEMEEKLKQEEEKRKQEEEEKKKKEEENKKESEEEKEDDDDTIAIDLPPEDASIAEAKPIGIAIAGEGGIAASKPIATAVVGPGGLAIARPVGTAIAGISPDQATLPFFVEGVPSSGKVKGTNADAFISGLSKFYQS